MMLFRIICPVNTLTKTKEKKSRSSYCRPLVRVVCMSCKNLVISSVSLVLHYKENSIDHIQL